MMDKRDAKTLQETIQESREKESIRICQNNMIKTWSSDKELSWQVLQNESYALFSLIDQTRQASDVS